MASSTETISTFAQIVDKLRTKSEVELKFLYMQLFKNDFIEHWKEITEKANFADTSDDEIIQAIQNKRYQREA